MTDRRTPLPVLLIVYALSLTLLGGVALASAQFSMPVHLFTQDMASIGGLHPLTGLLSNLGIVLWCTAAAACWFGWFLARRLAALEEGRFFLASAVLSSVLLFDDFFLFHESLAPRYLSIPEIAVVGVYGLLTAAYLLVFRVKIMAAEFVLLASSMVYFAVSVGVDLLPLDIGQWRTLVEDGAKFLGIAHWCAYHVRCLMRFQYSALLTEIVPKPSAS